MSTYKYKNKKINHTKENDKNTSTILILARMTQDRFDNLIFIVVPTYKQDAVQELKQRIDSTKKLDRKQKNSQN
tara:strand:- start:2659 stop:2880 length:222 start_codon:yes stop_codon:yes gene_type:complete